MRLQAKCGYRYDVAFAQLQEKKSAMVDATVSAIGYLINRMLILATCSCQRMTRCVAQCNMEIPP